MNKTIYDLELHEAATIKDATVHIMRVAGGWIYTFMTHNPISSIFVPFSNEFDITKNYIEELENKINKLEMYRDGSSVLNYDLIKLKERLNQLKK